MNTENIIRAWKDEEYRLSLSPAERVLLPDHPAGLIELTDADLEQIAGGANTKNLQCVPGHTVYIDDCTTYSPRGCLFPPPSIKGRICP